LQSGNAPVSIVLITSRPRRSSHLQAAFTNAGAPSCSRFSTAFHAMLAAQWLRYSEPFSKIPAVRSVRTRPASATSAWPSGDAGLVQRNGRVFPLVLGLLLYGEIVLHGFHARDLPGRPGRLGTGRHVRNLPGQRDDSRIGMNIDIGILETRVLHLSRILRNVLLDTCRNGLILLLLRLTR